MIIQTQIEELVRRIVKSSNPKKIILFGSYATGTQDEDSDLDLLIIVHDIKKRKHQRAREVRKHLWGVTDIPKDILVYTEEEIDEWKEVDEAFITTITKAGRVVYENKERADR